MSDKSGLASLIILHFFNNDNKESASGRHNQDYVFCFSWGWNSSQIINDTAVIPN